MVGSSINYELAFKNQEDALKFVQEFGGEIVDLDKAYDVGFERVETEKENLKYKNEKKFYPMGERIYKARCKEINIKDYRFINELKAQIFKSCENLDEKKAQIVLGYLWYKEEQKDSDNLKIEISHSDKCPVCGMFVHKYPRWATMVRIKDSKDNRNLIFDGVKDMMKFINEPKKYGFSDELEYELVLVNDYYTQETIDGKEAFYVFGSDVLGPMGNELIPFKKEADARVFKLEHTGTQILKFNEIKGSIICKLDGKACE